MARPRTRTDQQRRDHTPAARGNTRGHRASVRHQCAGLLLDDHRIPGSSCRSAPARVVNVASYWAGGLDLEDLEFKRRRYDNDAAYRQSKQADRMLTVAFAERLRGIADHGQRLSPRRRRLDLEPQPGFLGRSREPRSGREHPRMAGHRGRRRERNRQVLRASVRGILPFRSGYRCSRGALPSMRRLWLTGESRIHDDKSQPTRHIGRLAAVVLCTLGSTQLTAAETAAQPPTGAQAVTLIKTPPQILTRQKLPNFVGISAQTAGANGLSMNLVATARGRRRAALPQGLRERRLRAGGTGGDALRTGARGIGDHRGG